MQLYVFTISIQPPSQLILSSVFYSCSSAPGLFLCFSFRRLSSNCTEGGAVGRRFSLFSRCCSYLGSFLSSCSAIFSSFLFILFLYLPANPLIAFDRPRTFFHSSRPIAFTDSCSALQLCSSINLNISSYSFKAGAFMAFRSASDRGRYNPAS